MKGSSHSDNLLLSEYDIAIAETDQFPVTELTPILLGLFGEVGSVMSTAKKQQREKKAFAGYTHDVEEELGDTFWYFAALCRRLNVRVMDLFAEAISGLEFTVNFAANSHPNFPIAQINGLKKLESLDSILLRLGEKAAALLKLNTDSLNAKQPLLDFLFVYIEALQASSISFSTALNKNMAKTRGRYSKPSLEDLPDFDAEFSEDEQLPREFEIEISERSERRSYLRWKGVFIGDPLSDNIADPDGYRFHDVFHFANAAVLHWSPTFRALIKHKRKSEPHINEAQDSGRPIVVEEGLSAYIFSYAKSLDFFEGQDSVSFDLLKAVQNFVRGYEVDKCPLRLWEDAILQGYSVFRKLRENNGGVIVGNRNSRKIEYKPLQG